MMIYSDLMSLLAQRHSKDVFVPECKDGQSWGRTHRRLDAWAMRRSYSRFRLDGYEIKMSRADFLKDDKYTAYLPSCNCLWFVAPPKIIDPKELPDEVGLIVVASTGTRLYTKKKAPIRTIDPPVALYEYLLMSRTKIVSNGGAVVVDREARLEAFREYLDGKKTLHDIGWKLSTRVGGDISEMRQRTEHAEHLVKSYESIRSRLEELGLDPDVPAGDWVIDGKLRERGLLIEGRTRQAVKGIVTQIQRDLDHFNGVTAQGEEIP